METLARPKDDLRRLVTPQEYKKTIERLLDFDHSKEPVLVVSARDARTEVGPYIQLNKQMPQLGTRIIGSEMRNAGFPTRIALDAWNPNLRPGDAAINGLHITSLLISSMQIHYAATEKLIDDAYEMGEQRPWIGVGGPLCMYEPWRVLERPNGRNADIAFTGGGFALLQVNQRIDEQMRPGLNRRSVLEELMRSRLLDDLPGLMYSWTDSASGEKFLVDTGPQRMLLKLDVLPSGIDAFELMEPPHKGHSLMEKPLSFDQIRASNAKGSGPFSSLLGLFDILSLLTTHGCPENCNYCPIPEQAQATFSSRSVDKVIEDILRGRELLGARMFFGTDDNIYMSQPWVYELVTKLSSVKVDGKNLGELISFGTEGTVKGAFTALLKHPDLFEKAVLGGWKATWYGIEDVNGILVNKGQFLEKLFWVAHKGREAGHQLRPMLIHHEGQPYSSRSHRRLPKANDNGNLGAEEVQVPLKVTFDRISLPVPGNGHGQAYDIPRKETLEELTNNGEFGVRRMALLADAQRRNGEEAKAIELITADPKAFHLYQSVLTMAGAGKFFGLKEQVAMLMAEPFRAFSMQVNPITPSPGTEIWEQPFLQGKVISRIGNMRISYGPGGNGLYLIDGNHVIMLSDNGESKTAWQIQKEQLLAYLSFYNPKEMVKGICRAMMASARQADNTSLSELGLAEPFSVHERIKASGEWQYIVNQVMGLVGVGVSILRSRGFLSQLWKASRNGRIEKATEPPLPGFKIIQAGIRPMYPYGTPKLVAINGAVQPVYSPKENPPIIAPVR